MELIIMATILVIVASLIVKIWEGEKPSTNTLPERAPYFPLTINIDHSLLHGLENETNRERFETSAEKVCEKIVEAVFKEQDAGRLSWKRYRLNDYKRFEAEATVKNAAREDVKVIIIINEEDREYRLSIGFNSYFTGREMNWWHPVSVKYGEKTKEMYNRIIT